MGRGSVSCVVCGCDDTAKAGFSSLKEKGSTRHGCEAAGALTSMGPFIR